MLLANSPSVSTVLASRGTLLREVIARDNRVPRDERVDLPEIQESYRVSFSSGATAAGAGGARDAAQRPTFSDARGATEDPRLRAYRTISAL